MDECSPISVEDMFNAWLQPSSQKHHEKKKLVGPHGMPSLPVLDSMGVVITYSSIGV